MRLLIYWGNKLCLYPFDRVEGRMPETSQSDLSTVYRLSRESTECLIIILLLYKQ